MLAIAGMHAREWAQPDAVISFAQKLLAAYRGSTAFVIPAYSEGGNTYGPLSVDKDTIKAMLDRMDILLVPLANPDGRAFSQTAPGESRLAQEPRAATRRRHRRHGRRRSQPQFRHRPGTSIHFYSAAFVASGALSASKDPADPTFIGKPLPAPQSSHPNIEPEVRNLISLLDHFPVTYSVDLHSALAEGHASLGHRAERIGADAEFQEPEFTTAAAPDPSATAILAPPIRSSSPIRRRRVC